MGLVKRFENTDFRDSAEFIALAKMGPFPADFARNKIDEVLHSVDLAALGIKGEEYKKAMKRFKVSFQPSAVSNQ